MAMQKSIAIPRNIKEGVKTSLSSNTVHGKIMFINKSVVFTAIICTIFFKYRSLVFDYHYSHLPNLIIKRLVFKNESRCP